MKNRKMNSDELNQLKTKYSREIESIERQEIDCEIQSLLPTQLFNVEGTFVIPGKS